MELVRIADVPEEKVAYLWEPYLADRKVTILGGYPGVGKTWIGCALIGAISSGRPLPSGGAIRPRNCLLMTTEDDPSDTLRPRLRRLGADMQRVYVRDEKKDAFFRLDTAGMRKLYNTMADHNITYLHLDSIQAWMPSGTSTNDQTEVRAVLTELRENVLVPLNAAAIVTMHYRKPGRDASRGSGPAFNMLHGSQDFAGTARSVMMAIATPDGRRFVAHPKCSYAEEGGTWEYAVSRAAPYFEWVGPDPRDATALLSAKPPRETTADKIEEWLQATVPVMGMPSAELKREAESAGFSWPSVKRARAALGWITSGRGGVAWTKRHED